MVKGNARKVEAVQLDVHELMEKMGVKPQQKIIPKKLLKLIPVGSRTKVEGFGMFEREFDHNYYFAVNNKLYYLPPIQDYEKRFRRDSQYDDKYVVPFSAVKEVTSKAEGELKPKFKEPWDEPSNVSTPFNKDECDRNLGTMTLWEYACIHSGVPLTNVPWLDYIIERNAITR